MRIKDKRWTVGITDFVKPPITSEVEAFPEAEFIFLSDWRESDENKKQWQTVDAILVWHWVVDTQTAAVLDNCKIAVRYGMGYDRVDIQALADKNIVFCNTPGCGTTEVADTACAMILGLQRKIIGYNYDCRLHTDKWQQVLAPIERTGKSTLGVIGRGRIGASVIERMKPFGYRILSYDPFYSDSTTPDGFEIVDALDTLCARSDIVTVHCPLTPDTEKMIDRNFIGKMKPGASLVNTARGGLFESLDCIEEALKSGHLSSVALDVLPDEPPKDHPLLTAWRNDENWIKGRLIITPHTADYSEYGWEELHFKAAETARLLLTSGKVRNQIKPAPK